MGSSRENNQLERIKRFDERFRFGPRIRRVMKWVLPLAALGGIAGGLMLCQFVDQFRPLIQLGIFAPIVFAIVAFGLAFAVFYFFFNYGATPKTTSKPKRK